MENKGTMQDDDENSLEQIKSDGSAHDSSSSTDPTVQSGENVDMNPVDESSSTIVSKNSNQQHHGMGVRNLFFWRSAAPPVAPEIPEHMKEVLGDTNGLELEQADNIGLQEETNKNGDGEQSDIDVQDNNNKGENEETMPGESDATEETEAAAKVDPVDLNKIDAYESKHHPRNSRDTDEESLDSLPSLASRLSSASLEKSWKSPSPNISRKNSNINENEEDMATPNSNVLLDVPSVQETPENLNEAAVPEAGAGAKSNSVFSRFFRRSLNNEPKASSSPADKLEKHETNNYTDSEFKQSENGEMDRITPTSNLDDVDNVKASNITVLESKESPTVKFCTEENMNIALQDTSDSITTPMLSDEPENHSDAATQKGTQQPRKEEMAIATPEKMQPPAESLPALPLPPFPDAEIILKESIPEVSVQDYFNIAWSEGTSKSNLTFGTATTASPSTPSLDIPDSNQNQSEYPPLYGPWLTSCRKNNVNVHPWEDIRIERDDSNSVHSNSIASSSNDAMSFYTQQRIVTFDFKKVTIGRQSIVQVLHMQQSRLVQDQCVVHMSISMKGFPYAECFLVEVRHLATAKAASVAGIEVEIGLRVKFIKPCMMEWNIRKNTSAETKKAQVDLFRCIREACLKEVERRRLEEEEEEAVKEKEAETTAEEMLHGALNEAEERSHELPTEQQADVCSVEKSVETVVEENCAPKESGYDEKMDALHGGKNETALELLSTVINKPPQDCLPDDRVLEKIGQDEVVSKGIKAMDEMECTGGKVAAPHSEENQPLSQEEVPTCLVNEERGRTGDTDDLDKPAADDSVQITSIKSEADPTSNGDDVGTQKYLISFFGDKEKDNTVEVARETEYLPACDAAKNEINRTDSTEDSQKENIAAERVAPSDKMEPKETIAAHENHIQNASTKDNPVEALNDMNFPEFETSPLPQSTDHPQKERDCQCFFCPEPVMAFFRGPKSNQALVATTPLLTPPHPPCNNAIDMTSPVESVRGQLKAMIEQANLSSVHRDLILSEIYVIEASLNRISSLSIKVDEED